LIEHVVTENQHRALAGPVCGRVLGLPVLASAVGAGGRTTVRARLPASQAARAAPPRAARRLQALAPVTVFLLSSALWLAALGPPLLVETLATLPPPVTPRPALSTLADLTPVAGRRTAAWQKIPFVAPRDSFLRDFTIWRQMTFDDWDVVEPATRNAALEAMFRLYAPVLDGPAVWSRMSALDWDLVPQPVRAAAFMRMVDDWCDREGFGRAYDLDPREVADTVKAIVIAESWFEHRAVQEGPSGNRDLGLAQCSDFCRASLDRLHRQGLFETALTEADYLDPFVATRVAGVWLSIMLDETGGDLARAIGAYHRGARRAGDNRGLAYVETVLRRRSRYIRGGGSSPSWSRILELARQAPLPSRPLPGNAPLRPPLLD
jgi:hypothetical protein